MLINKKDIPLITHAQAAEIDRELQDRYQGGAIFPSGQSCIYGAYRKECKLHIIQEYLYDTEENRYDSVSNMGLYLDWEKDIYHITLHNSDACYSFSNFVQNRFGIMTTPQKLARISMASARISDVFKLIDGGRSAVDVIQ